jgi:hypothetical protein
LKQDEVDAVARGEWPRIPRGSGLVTRAGIGLEGVSLPLEPPPCKAGAATEEVEPEELLDFTGVVKVEDEATALLAFTAPTGKSRGRSSSSRSLLRRKFLLCSASFTTFSFAAFLSFSTFFSFLLLYRDTIFSFFSFANRSSLASPSPLVPSSFYPLFLHPIHCFLGGLTFRSLIFILSTFLIESSLPSLSRSFFSSSESTFHFLSLESQTPFINSFRNKIKNSITYRLLSFFFLVLVLPSIFRNLVFVVKFAGESVVAGVPERLSLDSTLCSNMRAAKMENICLPSPIFCSSDIV